VFVSLAALVKLPYILFAGVLIPEIYSPKGEISRRSVFLSTIFLVALVPVYLWYKFAIPSWAGNPIVQGMTGNEKTIWELLDILWFTVISSVPELLTNYAAFPLLLMGLYFFMKDPKLRFPRGHFLAVLILFSGYFLYEINLIEKTHEYYLMPFVPLIFLTVAFAVQRVSDTKLKWLIVLAVCLVPLTAWLRINHRWDPAHPGFNTDYLVHQLNLQRNIPKDGICIVDSDPSSFICLYYLKRRGYSLKEKEISSEKVEELYNKGARYLISEDTLFDPSRYPKYKFELLFQNEIRLWGICSVNG
jgi:hypothetical protein